MKRPLQKLIRRTPLWAVLALVVLAPLVLLNLAVAFFGNTIVFPLSPFFLKEKAGALRTYAGHRVRCLFEGHLPLQPLVAAAERRHDLPRGLLEALVEVESRGLPHRISGAGAMGPAQLMPGTAALLGVHDPFDSPEAIDGSARYLSQQLVHFGRIDLAVAAYNAGPGNVEGAVPHNGETEHYVRKVLAAYAARRPRVLPAPVKAAPKLAETPRPAAAPSAPKVEPIRPRPIVKEAARRPKPGVRPKVDLL